MIISTIQREVEAELKKIKIINHDNLLNEYVLHIFLSFLFVCLFVCFLSNVINCQEQLKTIQQTEKKKKCTSFLGVCIISLIVLCDTISV